MSSVICMMDDVLVYPSIHNTHWQRLWDVLGRIKNCSMTLREDKWEFDVQSVLFLGHIASGDGVKPDPEKVKTIVEMSVPTNQKEAKRLMGTVNYLGKFSKNLFELCALIQAIVGQSSQWYWGAEQPKSPDNIKVELSRVDVLCAFDVSCKHRVSAGSNQLVLGAVLFHINCRDDWQPVEYASRKLTEVETMHMVEKESLAVTWACAMFYYYMVGRQFERD